MELIQAFPRVPIGERPMGPRVLIQLQTIRTVSEGGIVLVEATKEVNKVLNQVGMLVDKGSIAFCNRDTGLPWSEGVWADIGDLVRIPKYVGQRFHRDIPETQDRVEFIILDDHQILSRIDPAFFNQVSEIK